MSFPPQPPRQGPFGSPPPPPGGFPPAGGGPGFGGGPPRFGPGGPGGFGPGPGGFGGGPRHETSGKATTALVLGILGIVACPLICSVLAIVFGVQAKGEIDRSGGYLSGRGLAQAGFALGWIGLALWGIFVVLIIIGVLAGDDTSSTDFSMLFHATREALPR